MTGAREIEMRVYSKHLSFASKVFGNMFEDLSSHPGEDDNGSRTVPLEGDDLHSLQILLNIVHGLTRRVPREVDICVLSQIVFLIDKYEFHEVAEILTDMWFEHLQPTLPQKFEQSLASWVYICYELRKPVELERLAKIAIVETKCGLEDPDGRVPVWIIGKFASSKMVRMHCEFFRRNTISPTASSEQLATDTLSELLQVYMGSFQICPNEDCDALALGKFIRALSTAQLYPIPDSSSLDRPIADLFAVAEMIQLSLGCQKIFQEGQKEPFWLR
jgi:hypothetical protein